jgi:myo-inositol 2-dehydrogenase/D-chiro-inositol 1-dehydrogenase
MNKKKFINSRKISRRQFTKATAGAALAGAVLPSITCKAATTNPDKIKIGLIGCGGRGTGAVMDVINAAPNIELVAMADLFMENIRRSLKTLRSPQKGRTRDFAGQYGSLVVDFNGMNAVKVKPENCFSGFDAYRHILQTDIDILISGTPPYCRPKHIRAAVEADKHVFAEKPVAVDPKGIRSVLESVELAKRKNLGFMGGTQLRFSKPYNEVISRIHDGQIGKVTSVECYWWHDYFVNWHVHKRKPEWSDMEFQIRCWPHFVWTGGDHIVENLVHNIDVMNWIMGGPPESAVAIGGHSNWKDWKVKGNVYDHFYVEYTYPNGVKGHASSRQIKNCTYRLAERAVGAKGIANPYRGIDGEKPYDYSGQFDNPRYIQWAKFINSIRKNNPMNQGKQIAQATMTAILGRMAAYTGRAISYKWALQSSKLDLLPPKFEFGPHPVEAQAIPGITPLV